MPLFIRPPDRKDFGTLAMGPEGTPIWDFRGPFDDPDMRDAYSRPVSEADFTNGSAFFEADSTADLDWCDHILDRNLVTAFITPDGKFYSFIAHEAFIERILKTALGEEDGESAIRGWIRISHQPMAFRPFNPRQSTIQKTGIVTHCWHHSADRNPLAPPISRRQMRMLEKIGYSPIDKEENARLQYEDVFGARDTSDMENLRKKVADVLKNKHRIIQPPEARILVQKFLPGYGARPGAPKPD